MEVFILLGIAFLILIILCFIGAILQFKSFAKSEQLIKSIKRDDLDYMILAEYEGHPSNLDTEEKKQQFINRIKDKLKTIKSNDPRLNYYMKFETISTRRARIIVAVND